MELILPWVEQFSDHSLLLFLSIFSLSFANMFFPPLPLEALTFFGSYAAGAGYGNPVIIWLATVAGMSIGGILLYWLAFEKGEFLLSCSWFKRHINPKDIAKSAFWVQRYGIWTIYFGKCITGMSFIVVLGCGLFKVKKRKALIAIICSNVIYYGALVLSGRYLGRKWQAWTLPGGKITGSIILLSLIIMTGVIIYFIRSQRRVKKDKAE